MAAVQVAMVVTLPVEPAGDVGHGRQQPVEICARGVGPPTAGTFEGRESAAQIMVQLRVARQFFGQHERFQQPVATQLLAKGDDCHGRDASLGEPGDIFGLDPAGGRGDRCGKLARIQLPRLRT